MIFLAPPVLFNLYISSAKVGLISKNLDIRSKLEIYSDYTWAEQHFLEFNNLSTSYYDYVTWRRDDFIGETVNIRNGLRKTANVNTSENSSQSFWFFGGSTTWGTGVDDQHTFPSLFANATRKHVTNFGETAYIARQSLAYMNNYIVANDISNLLGVNIIFYDGVNDIAHRCRSEIDGLGTGRETQIRNELNFSPYRRFGFKKTFHQLTDFIAVVLERYSPFEIKKESLSESYSCASDDKRAREVAETLVNTWSLASDFVKSRGGEFTAILQPVAYFGNPDISYLSLINPRDKVLSDQYQAVYPLILEAAARKNFRFLDYTDAFDGCRLCYIDFCHVGPQANKILVSRIVFDLIG